MGEEQRTGSTAMNEAREPEQIRSEIEETRRDLGDTVAALSAKTDVKARAKERIDNAKTTVTEKTDEFVGKAKEVSPDAALSAASSGTEKVKKNPLPAAAFGAFALGFLLGRLTGGAD